VPDVSTTTITGNELTLVIDSETYAPQVLSVELEVEDTQETFETLAGPAYRTTTQPFSMNLTMLADWGENGGLCSKLQAKALGEGSGQTNRAPDTGITFTMTQTGASHATVFTGKVFPKVPPMGGTGAEVSEITFTLPGERGTLEVETAAIPS
jgi:hypothetical protein